jgi:hypothetical protein
MDEDIFEIFLGMRAYNPETKDEACYMLPAFTATPLPSMIRLYQGWRDDKLLVRMEWCSRLCCGIIEDQRDSKRCVRHVFFFFTGSAREHSY